MPPRPDDDPLHTEFLAGKPTAIAEIRRMIELVVRGFAFPDPGTGRDLVQEALTRIFLNLTSGQFRGEASFRTYCARIARFTCLEHIRRRRFESAVDPEALPSSARWSAPEDSFLWTEEHLRNLDRFSSLPCDCRELLRLVFIEGKSYRETAIALGITEGALRTRIHRCRSALRRDAVADRAITRIRRPQDREN